MQGGPGCGQIFTDILTRDGGIPCPDLGRMEVPPVRKDGGTPLSGRMVLPSYRIGKEQVSPHMGQRPGRGTPSPMQTDTKTRGKTLLSLVLRTRAGHIRYVSQMSESFEVPEGCGLLMQ